MLKPKSGQSSRRTHSPNKSKKFKQVSARKLMATVFWDRKGVLMVEYMQQGTTVTSEEYRKTLKNCVGPFRAKGSGMLTSGLVFRQDNVHLHTAACSQALLEHFIWELFDHPPYGPDLTPNDYHLFTYLKNWLGSQRFNNNEELMGGVG
jgi:histone-lysine N-methyltransferase SETMAR